MTKVSEILPDFCGFATLTKLSAISTWVVGIWWLDPLCLPINCGKYIKGEKVNSKLFWAHLQGKNDKKSLKNG